LHSRLLAVMLFQSRGPQQCAHSNTDPEAFTVTAKSAGHVGSNPGLGVVKVCLGLNDIGPQSSKGAEYCIVIGGHCAFVANGCISVTERAGGREHPG
jgi:hypothetical protein